MNFEWFAGPHAAYIIPAYLLSLVVMAYTALAPIMTGRKQRRQLRQNLQDDSAT